MSLLGRSSKTTSKFCLDGKRLPKARAFSRLGFHKGFRKKSRDDDKCVAPANPRKLPGIRLSFFFIFMNVFISNHTHSSSYELVLATVIIVIVLVFFGNR